MRAAFFTPITWSPWRRRCARWPVSGSPPCGCAIVKPTAALAATAIWQAYIEATYLGWTIGTAQGVGAAILELVDTGLGDWRILLLVALAGGTAVAVWGLRVRGEDGGHPAPR